MTSFEKCSQLQIRVSPAQKKAINHAASQAGMGMSEFVLTRLFPPQKEQLKTLINQLAKAKITSNVLAEIHDLFQKMTASQFAESLDGIFLLSLTPYLQNYVAAMIEYGAVQKKVAVPLWLKQIKPLAVPVFGSELKSLRLYLLTHSPIAFRKRNIFIDSTLGDRV